jgi:hypothetical protein
MKDTSESNAPDDSAYRNLRRLEMFLDVAYAVLTVDFIMYLPQTENMAWTELPYGLFSLLGEDPDRLLRLVISVGLTLISWNLTRKLLAPLVGTNGRHSLLVLLQFLFVCLFLFFAIADPALVSVSSPAGQSICLAISGFIGIAAFIVAQRAGYLRSELTQADGVQLVRSAVVEPVTALLNTGLAFVGPGAWTLGWFVIPLGLIAIRRYVER